MAEPSPLPKLFTISIIGGGLGGLLLAIGLSTRGVPVRIYEAAPGFTETGAGIGFGPNAVRAMTMLDPRIRDAYDLLKTENRWESKKNTWFDFRVGWGPVPELVAELKMGVEKEGGGNVLRTRFMEELVKLLPRGCAAFGKTLSRMEESDGRVKLWFGDGTTSVADAVVGCDGIRSVVRKLLLGKDHEASKAVFSGVYVYRGLLDMETAIAAVGEELALNSQVYMGKDGDLVTYPIEDGSVLNVVAFRKHKEDTWEHPRWVVDSSHEELMRDFEGWGELPQRILKVIFYLSDNRG
jgi:salicylate hydroxylase